MCSLLFITSISSRSYQFFNRFARKSLLTKTNVNNLKQNFLFLKRQLKRNGGSNWSIFPILFKKRKRKILFCPWFWLEDIRLSSISYVELIFRLNSLFSSKFYKKFYWKVLNLSLIFFYSLNLSLLRFFFDYLIVISLFTR